MLCDGAVRPFMFRDPITMLALFLFFFLAALAEVGVPGGGEGWCAPSRVSPFSWGGLGFKGVWVCWACGPFGSRVGGMCVNGVGVFYPFSFRGRSLCDVVCVGCSCHGFLGVVPSFVPLVGGSF